MPRRDVLDVRQDLTRQAAELSHLPYGSRPRRWMALRRAVAGRLTALMKLREQLEEASDEHYTGTAGPHLLDD